MANPSQFILGNICKIVSFIFKHCDFHNLVFLFSKITETIQNILCNLQKLQVKSANTVKFNNHMQLCFKK